ncbi:MAG TPA: hypothetical protein VKR83_15220 [Ktedonobacteraceae bacterium]|nr:hypothetical protein [Ktedonobacteraceae bacterium]
MRHPGTDSSQKEQQGESSPTIFDKVPQVQTVLVAILLVAQILPQPHLSSGVFAEGGGVEYGVPLVVFLVLAVSLATGYWLALAGALRAHWSVGFPVIALSTGLLAVQPLTALFTLGNGVGARLAPYTAERWMSLAQLVVLAVFWLQALSSLLKRKRRLLSSERQAGIRQRYGRVLIGVLALLLIYYGLAFGIWLTFVRAGLAMTGTGFLLNAFGLQVLYLPLFLVLPILALSTDLLDSGQKIVKHFLFIKPGEVRFPRLLPGLTALVAMGMIVYKLLQDGSGLMLGLATILALAGIVALLVRFARVDEHWTQEIPSIWLFLGAAFFLLY